ncbi:MAG TPA: type II toxin-antitoxin system RelE/ParE family toxin [Longimicrobium sp.]
MIVSFEDEGTRDIFLGRDSRAARRTCPSQLWAAAFRKLEALDRARRVDQLREPPGNRLERLKGSRRGTYSIRINDQYRVCFCWAGVGPEDVEIVDYH